MKAVAIRPPRRVNLAVSPAELDRVAARLAPAIVALCAFLFAASLYGNVRAGLWGFDFEGTLWRAGRDILAGMSPYPAADAAALERQGNPAVYPASTLVAAVPLSLLPLTVATLLWNVVNVGALAGALRLVGLRDPQCFALALLSFPVASSLILGQLDGLLALGCAAAWRYRDRALVAVAAVAAVVAAKLFLWPLLVWLAATRGLRAGAAAAAGAAGAIVAGWAVLGFAGMREYPALLGALADAFQHRGHSLVAAALRLDVPVEAARALPWVAGGAILLLAVALSRRADGDRRSFAAAIGAGIFLSPVVWMHYFVLLLLVLAIGRPRMGLVWLLVAGFWISPMEPAASTWRLLAGLACALLVLATAARRARAAQPAVVLT